MEDAMEMDSARELIQQVPERVREWRPPRALESVPQRARELLPDAAQERLRGKRRRPRWLLVGAVAGFVVAGLWLAFKLKSVLAPGYDDEDEEPLGEPLDYPATGSGTGWPDGGRSAANTEIVGEAITVTAGPSAEPAPPPAAVAAAPPAPPVVASPHLSSG